MAKRRKWFSHAVLAMLGVFATGLVVLQFFYPLRYVYRALVYQESDFSDIHRFPARPIAASQYSTELPVAKDPHAKEVFERYPEVGKLEAFLEETETSAFLVVHKGRLVEERYLRGHNRESMQNTFSVSKSVASALVGLALRDGLLNLNDPITQFIPEFEKRDRRFAKITVEHLLDMRSGIRYSPDVAFPIVNADDPLIYYHPDLESVILSRTTVATDPGDFQYNNYNTPLIGLILRRATGIPAAEYLQREVWQPMGAEHAAGWTVDDHGLERMESGFHACARDLARFGLLYLRHGLAAGRRVVPESWVRDSTDVSEPWELDRYDGRTWGYRAGWWIVPRAEKPADYCAIGRYGQFIYLSPQYDAVFVRNGPGRGGWGDFDWTALFYFVSERL